MGIKHPVKPEMKYGSQEYNAVHNPFQCTGFPHRFMKPQNDIICYIDSKNGQTAVKPRQDIVITDHSVVKSDIYRQRNKTNERCEYRQNIKYSRKQTQGVSVFSRKPCVSPLNVGKKPQSLFLIQFKAGANTVVAVQY